MLELGAKFDMMIVGFISTMCVKIALIITLLCRKCGVCKSKEAEKNNEKLTKLSVIALARHFNLPLNEDDIVNYNRLNESVSVNGNDTSISLE